MLTQPKRMTLQGVTNIVRFNWPLFAIALFGLVVAFVSLFFLHGWPFLICLCVIAAVGIGLFFPLFISAWVYDFSGIYNLPWLPIDKKPKRLLNLNAGFDESSLTIQHRYPDTQLDVYDFYNPKKHTEASIRRARKAYPPYLDTQPVAGGKIPLPAASCDLIHMMFCLHEIRESKERVAFLRELRRLCVADAEIIVIEHLRDLPNALAYTLGSLHFHSHQSWIEDFAQAGLIIKSEKKHTPFVSVFTLQAS